MIKKDKTTRKSLSIRLPLLFVASMMVIIGAVIILVHYRFHDRMIDQYTRMADASIHNE